MSDIQRYSIDGTCTVNGQISVFDYETDAGKYVRHADHIKAIEAKDKEIENLKAHEKQLENGFDKQAKEIERLKRAVESVFELIDESDGVSGFHQNGEIIYWCSLLRGGQFEEWLSPLSEVQELTK